MSEKTRQKGCGLTWKDLGPNSKLRAAATNDPERSHAKATVGIHSGKSSEIWNGSFWILVANHSGCCKVVAPGKSGPTSHPQSVGGDWQSQNPNNQKLMQSIFPAEAGIGWFTLQRISTSSIRDGWKTQPGNLNHPSSPGSPLGVHWESTGSPLPTDLAQVILSWKGWSLWVWVEPVGASSNLMTHQI